jgi:hypothetical protein
LQHRAVAKDDENEVENMAENEEGETRDNADDGGEDNNDNDGEEVGVLSNTSTAPPPRVYSSAQSALQTRLHNSVFPLPHFHLNNQETTDLIDLYATKNQDLNYSTTLVKRLQQLEHLAYYHTSTDITLVILGIEFKVSVSARRLQVCKLVLLVLGPNFNTKSKLYRDALSFFRDTPVTNSKNGHFGTKAIAINQSNHPWATEHKINSIFNFFRVRLDESVDSILGMTCYCGNSDHLCPLKGRDAPYRYYNTIKTIAATQVASGMLSDCGKGAKVEAWACWTCGIVFCQCEDQWSGHVCTT